MGFIKARGSLYMKKPFKLERSVKRPVIHHPGAVAILAQPDATHVLLVRQFRYPVRGL